MSIEKRFPADTSLDSNTFLNDHKIDGELYALLQQHSYPVDKETRVMKKDLPTQVSMCDILGIKSPKTLRAHKDYLVQQGYLIEYKDYYVLPNKENIYLLIPLKTLQFLNDTIKDQVIKVYVYLGQRWKYKQEEHEYIFTMKEVGQHIGIKVEGSSRNYQIVANALDCLRKLGLIDFVEYTEVVNGKPVPRKKLVNFTFDI